MEFIIKNEGFIYEKEWVYDEEKEAGQYETTFLNPTLDFTNKFLIANLDKPITLDEGFTVRDWFKLVINYPSLQFLDGYMESYIKEYKKCPENNCIDPENQVNTIVIKKIIELSNFGEDDKKFECQIYNDIYGDSKDIHYGIDFWELKNFLDIPLKMIQGVYIRDDINRKSHSDIIVEEVNITYTLFDLIKSFVYELSWWGTTEEKNKKLEEMQDTVKKIESGEVETTPYDFKKDNNNDK